MAEHLAFAHFAADHLRSTFMRLNSPAWEDVGRLGGTGIPDFRPGSKSNRDEQHREVRGDRSTLEAMGFTPAFA
ncbi:hypothetical protein ACTWPT_39550 [Nonomuraea sp. 3N208]|uniref:hypothetical protein n=1 Tax=Nonomuraea sp. 3N208 TaxID=3457421 RepID=UPI003FD414BC